MSQYIQEAFKKFNLLEEEDFNLDTPGVEDLKSLMDDEDIYDFEDVIDPEAETEEELEDSYVGKVILECKVCHSKIYKDASDVHIDEETELANVDEECPFCYAIDGFEIVGQVAPYEETEVKVDVEPKEDEIEVEETKDDEKLFEDVIDEDINNKKICIDNLTTNQIEKLPDEFLCISRQPGLSYYLPVFGIVSKEDFIKNPEKCFYIDSYWGYASPRNVYVATPSQLKEYEDEQIQNIKDAISKYKSYLIRYDISLSNESLNEASNNYFILVGSKVVSANSFDDAIRKAYKYVKQGKKEVTVDSNRSNFRSIDFTSLDDFNGYADIINESFKEGLDFKTMPISKEGATFAFSAKVDQDKVLDIIQKNDLKYSEVSDNGVPVWLIGHTDTDHIATYVPKTQTLYTDTREAFRECFEESLEEDLENLDIETEHDVIHVEAHEKEGEGEEVIAPIEPAQEVDIMTDSEEVPAEEVPAEDEIDSDIEDFSEEEFNSMGESYLKKVYENVNSFKTSSVKQEGNFLVVEGFINFKSGKNKKTTFKFESKDAFNGKVRFIGENLQICKGKKAFTLIGSLNESKFTPTSFRYNYRVNGNRVYGTVVSESLNEANLSDQEGTASNIMSQKDVMAKLNDCKSAQEVKDLVNSILPEKKKNEPKVKKLLMNLDRANGLEKAQSMFTNFILKGDNLGVIK